MYHNLLLQGQQYSLLVEEQQQNCLDNLTAMFGNRQLVVLENVTKILGTVHSTMNAGKHPYDMLNGDQGKQQSLVNLVAGVKSLRDVGSQGDGQELRNHMQKVQSTKQGLDVNQAEVAALKNAGSSSRGVSKVKQAFDDFSDAIKTGDHARIKQLKDQFGDLHSFYQQLRNKVAKQQTASMY